MLTAVPIKFHEPTNKSNQGSKSKIKWECEGFGLYDENGDFTYDQATWAQWYEQNKCTITMEKAEAIFSKTREPFPDYDDPKVLKLIGSKLDESDRGSARYIDSIDHVNFWAAWPKVNIERQNAR